MARVSQTTTVPDGSYCEYRGDNTCQHLVKKDTIVDWRDGLGSPGTIRSYKCGFFCFWLTPEPVPGPDKGFCIPKCAECVRAEEHG